MTFLVTTSVPEPGREMLRATDEVCVPGRQPSVPELRSAFADVIVAPDGEAVRAAGRAITHPLRLTPGIGHRPRG